MRHQRFSQRPTTPGWMHSGQRESNTNGSALTSMGSQPSSIAAVDCVADASDCINAVDSLVGQEETPLVIVTDVSVRLRSLGCGTRPHPMATVVISPSRDTADRKIICPQRHLG